MSFLKYQYGNLSSMRKYSRFGKLQYFIDNFPHFFVQMMVNLIVFQFVNTCIDL